MPAIIPQPLRLETRDGEPFVLSASTRLVVDASQESLALWFTGELERLTGITIVVGPEVESPAIRIWTDPGDGDLTGLPVSGGVRPDIGDPGAERHAVVIDADAIRIRALAPEGVFRGMSTLLQLAATAPREAGAIVLPPQTIFDAPRFAWRGLSFDVVRRFSTVEQVKQVIDLLALYKANVLHLHLTDAEGWRIQIDAWPKLAEVAGQIAANDRPGGFYTKEQFADIVSYAAERFITVVPEIEMPGHAAAIFRAYPELAGNGTDPETTNLHRSPWFQMLRPDNPRVRPFLADVLSEVAAMTPGAFLHIGGDEALGMEPELYAQLMREAKGIVYDLGKRVVAWQETARSGFQPGDVAQAWLDPSPRDFSPPETTEPSEGFEAPPEEVRKAFGEAIKLAPFDLGKALDQGAMVLVSFSPIAYLDTKYRENSTDPAQNATHARLGLPFYTPSTVAEFFDWDPASIKASLDESRIAGVEAAIWCETIETFDDLVFLLLPRLPGILEKGWSPPADAETRWDAYAPRLAAQAPLWERHGWPYFRSSVVWSHPA
jgi:hexosaminidase